MIVLYYRLPLLLPCIKSIFSLPRVIFKVIFLRNFQHNILPLFFALFIFSCDSCGLLLMDVSVWGDDFVDALPTNFCTDDKVRRVFMKKKRRQDPSPLLAQFRNPSSRID